MEQKPASFARPAEESAPTSVRVGSFIPAALVLVILGAGGLYLTLINTEPSGGTRWLFFFTGVMALTGVALPVVAYLNRRFPSTPSPTPGVIVRQSLWVGIYAPILVWLRIGRVANPALAILLAASLILIEWLLRMRERSQWKPPRRS